MASGWEQVPGMRPGRAAVFWRGGDLGPVGTVASTERARESQRGSTRRTPGGADFPSEVRARTPTPSAGGRSSAGERRPAGRALSMSR